MPLGPYSCTPPCPMHLLDTQEPRLLLEASDISDESVDTLSHSYGKRGLPIIRDLGPRSCKPARRGVTPYATLEHTRANPDALRAGYGGWAQQTGYAIGGTAQLAFAPSPPPSLPPGRATLKEVKVMLRVGWSCWRTGPRATTRTELQRD